MVYFQNGFLSFTIVFLTLLKCSNLVLGAWEWPGCLLIDEPLAYSTSMTDCTSNCPGLCWQGYSSTAVKCLPYKEAEAFCQCCSNCYRPINRATSMGECKSDCKGRCLEYGSNDHRCLNYKVNEGICECCPDCFRPLPHELLMADCLRDCPGKCKDHGILDNRCVSSKSDQAICECCKFS